MSDFDLEAYKWLTAEVERLTTERDAALATIERLDEDVAKWISQAVDAEATIERVKALCDDAEDCRDWIKTTRLRAALEASS